MTKKKVKCLDNGKECYFVVDSKPEQNTQEQPPGFDVGMWIITIVFGTIIVKCLWRMSQIRF